VLVRPDLVGRLACRKSTLPAAPKSAGVDALQIFDSHGGQLAPAEFQEASGRWIRDIITQLGGRVPVIVFSFGTHGNWSDLLATGANVISVDWQTSLAEARKIIPAHIAIQGNLSPVHIAESATDVVATETKKILEAMRGRPGHIFNLGHGILPGVPVDHAIAMVRSVHEESPAFHR